MSLVGESSLCVRPVPPHVIFLATRRTWIHAQPFEKTPFGFKLQTQWFYMRFLKINLQHNNKQTHTHICNINEDYYLLIG